MVPIYYINLAKRSDRRKYMEAQLASMGLIGHRIDAVTPDDLSPSDIDLYCNPGRPVFLRQSELSCTLSHEKAWQTMLDDSCDRALVLEDDVKLSTMLPAFLKDAETVDADLIRVETTGNATRVYPAFTTGTSGVAIRSFRSTPMGTAGYVIRASAARRIIGSKALRVLHTDLALYSPFNEPGSLLTRVLSDPAMCQQLNMTNQKAVDLARSDIAVIQAPHTFAAEYPVRFFAFKSWRGFKKGFRNAIDHFAQQSKGLKRRVIPFGE